MKLNLLEKAILDYVADRSSDPELKDQVTAVEAIRHKYTGVGMYIYLFHPNKNEALKIKSPTNPYSGPNIESSKLQHGAGSVVWCGDDGFLSEIEIFSYSDDYPNEEFNFTLDVQTK